MAARRDAAAFEIEGKISCVGGTEGDQQSADGAITQHDQYNIDTDSWLSKQSIPVGNMQSGSYAISGFGYIVGGYGYFDYGEKKWATQYSKANYMYDPTGDAWATKSSLSQHRFGQPNSTIEGKGMNALGIWDPESEGIGTNEFLEFKLDASVYDPATNTWYTTADVPKHDWGGDPVDSVKSGWRDAAGEALGAFYCWIDYYIGLYKYDNSTQTWSEYWDFSQAEGRYNVRFNSGGVIW